MIAISTSPVFEPSLIFDAQTYDPEKGTELTVAASEIPMNVVVRIVLIDWASVFELEAIVVNLVSQLTHDMVSFLLFQPFLREHPCVRS